MTQHHDVLRMGDAMDQIAHRPPKRSLKDRLLNSAESLAYDLIGFPVAIAYLAKRHRQPPSDNPAYYIRGLYCAHYWSRGGGALRGVFAGLAWPFALAADAVLLTSRNGTYVREIAGKSIIRQLGEQIALASRKSVVPYWYYMFEIYDDRRCEAASLYLQRYETKGYILDLLQPKNDDGMQDKAEFWRHCRAAGVRAVPVLMVVSAGETVMPDPAEAQDLPGEDLFVKPRIGRGGRNAERWDYDGQGGWRNQEVITLDVKGLLKHLTGLSGKRDYVVQPRLANHPDLTAINNGALATVRIVTCRNETGGFEATDAAFRMAIGMNSTVDNFHAGGIAAAVDMKTGRLGPASNMGLKPDVGWRKVHPDTKAAIEGRTLPFWPEVIDLAKRAHAAFPERIIVGWDIGILADGPTLIEGNIKPDLDIHQRVSRAPLGNGRLAELLAFNVARRLEGTD